MDKTEAKNRLEIVQKFYKNLDYKKGGYTHGYIQGLEAGMMVVDQLDEPEKIVVPLYVAEWIEGYKEQGYTLSNAIYNIVRGQEELEIEGYLRENPRAFISAFDDGYTIEIETANPEGAERIYDTIGELRSGNEHKKKSNRGLQLEIKEMKKDIKSLKKDIRVIKCKAEEVSE